VTKANINDTVVKDGIYKVADICTASFQAACTAAGLK
jgi:D-xylose transport system substrate-binding protein